MYIINHFIGSGLQFKVILPVEVDNTIKTGDDLQRKDRYICFILLV